MSSERWTRKNEWRTNELVGKWVKAASVGHGKWTGQLKNERGTVQSFKSGPVLIFAHRGITMDIALNSFSTPHRHITILDAPGHRDFIPNMISGASQADCALLVVDASTGEFEAGFDRGGQTREHLVLVRSLGVSQVVVAVNKLDVVGWDRSRYTEIVDALKPFLLQTGFQNSKTKFAPVAAMSGMNLVDRGGADGAELRKWYKGPTLVDLLGVCRQATREILGDLIHT